MSIKDARFISIITLKADIGRLIHEHAEAANRAGIAAKELKIAKDKLAVLICPVQAGDIIYHKDVRRVGRVKVPVLKRLEVGEVYNSGHTYDGGVAIKGWNIRKDGARGAYIQAHSFEKWVRESDGLIVFKGGL